MKLMVFGGDTVGDKAVLRSFADHFRFSLPLAEGSDDKPAVRLFNAAIDTNRDVDVTVDWGAVELDPESNLLLIPLCSARFDEMAVTIGDPCPRPASRLPTAYVEYARALVEPEDKDALTSISAALDRGGMSDVWRRRAIEQRATIYESLAFSEPLASAAQDRYLLLALADYRELEKHPDFPRAALDGADVLSRLGGYKEAWAAAEQTDPADDRDLAFQRSITMASIARLDGRPAEALDILNRQFAEDGSEAGMKLHYHRGRTFMMLGRFDEAIADFTSGFATQPEYPAAFIMRGCAYAALGEFRRASDDFRDGDRLYATMTAESALATDRQRLAQMISAVDAFGRAGKTGGDQQVCASFITEIDGGRPRSPLLP